MQFPAPCRTFPPSHHKLSSSIHGMVWLGTDFKAQGHCPMSWHCSSFVPCQLRARRGHLWSCWTFTHTAKSRIPSSAPAPPRLALPRGVPEVNPCWLQLCLCPQRCSLSPFPAFPLLLERCFPSLRLLPVLEPAPSPKAAFLLAEGALPVWCGAAAQLLLGLGQHQAAGMESSQAEFMSRVYAQNSVHIQSS